MINLRRDSALRRTGRTPTIAEYHRDYDSPHVRKARVAFVSDISPICDMRKARVAFVSDIAICCKCHGKANRSNELGIPRLLCQTRPAMLGSRVSSKGKGQPGGNKESIFDCLSQT
jgi:cytochrome c553